MLRFIENHFQANDLMEIIEQQTQHLSPPEETNAASTSNTPGKDTATPGHAST